jgi:hypothetical protein
MKAEERKEIETNSLVLAVQRFRKHASGRTLYYVIGTVALLLGGILLYRYFVGESRKTRDETLRQLAAADTAEKLKEGMETHRGSITGNLFKLHFARHQLKNEGLPRLGTDQTKERTQAAASVELARTHFLELTGELKEKEEPALVQEAWLGAAQAEEALIGLPTADDKNDSRGDVDKAIEYYDKAASIFPDKDFSKRYKERADFLRANRERFVSDQREIYKGRDLGSFAKPPAGPPVPTGPSLPATDVVPPKSNLPIPSLPPVPSGPEPAKTPDPKAADPPKGADPKAK